MYHYLRNCFLLLIPIFIWNIAFAEMLPEKYTSPIFWTAIPPFVKYTENILRVIVFVLPAIMQISFKTKCEKIGWIIYFVGIGFYFLSWVIQIMLPLSSWSNSYLGFMAPAYTTIIWFIGIGLIGNKSYFIQLNMTKLYITVSTLFVMIHSYHCFLIFQRTLI